MICHLTIAVDGELRPRFLRICGRPALTVCTEIAARRLLFYATLVGADSSVFSFLCSHFSARGQQLRFRIHMLLESVLRG
jgi:hypothetical protein